MILTKAPIHHLNPLLDPFWLESFTWWKEMAGDNLTATNDWEPDEVTQVPIVGMHQITIPTATQISSTKVANSGIVLLQHMLWPEAIPALQVQAWRIAQ